MAQFVLQVNFNPYVDDRMDVVSESRCHASMRGCTRDAAHAPFGRECIGDAMRPLVTQHSCHTTFACHTTYICNTTYTCHTMYNCHATYTCCATYTCRHPFLLPYLGMQLQTVLTLCLLLLSSCGLVRGALVALSFRGSALMGEYSTWPRQIFSASQSVDFPLFPASLQGYTDEVVTLLHCLLLILIGMGVCLWLSFLLFEVRSIPLT